MIKILKSGSWALEGVHVVEVAEGEVLHFSAAEEFKMVEAGWAEWAQPEAPAEVVVAVLDDSALEAPRKRGK